LFLGDSHIAQYGPRFWKLAKQEAVHTGIFVLDGGCTPIPDVFSDDPIRKNCKVIRDKGFALAERKDITTVVIGGAWNWYFLTSDEHYLLDAGKKVLLNSSNFKGLLLERLKKLLLQIKSEDKRVILLLDNPVGDDFNPYLFRRQLRLVGVSVFVSSVTPIETRQSALRRELASLAEEVGVEIIDPNSKLCVDDLCIRSTRDGIPVYQEGSHLSAQWVRDNADYIDQTLLDR
jgi:hypothetical protein